MKKDQSCTSGPADMPGNGIVYGGHNDGETFGDF